jgi:hypothetical protein
MALSDWTELENLSGEIADSQSRLAAARSTQNHGLVKLLDRQITEAEKWRDRLLSQITARMWNATRDIFNSIPDSGFIRVRGRVENYQNNLQFIMENLWPAKSGSFEVADLVPHTEKDVPAMFAKLSELLGSIQNRHAHRKIHCCVVPHCILRQHHFSRVRHA